MNIAPGFSLRLASKLVIALLLAGFVISETAYADDEGGNKSALLMPLMNAERGRKAFVDKGCVACHAINGTGGHDAPSMDAHANMGPINPFEFAAKMWNHAPGMIAAQEEAFGEQINFTGEELADIIAFVHDDVAQHSFTEKNLTAQARKMMGHEHGGAPAPDAHAEEVGHGHAPGAPTHSD